MSLNLIRESLLSNVCWSVIGGDGAGTAIQLAFGDKVPRVNALKNLKLLEEERMFAGEFSLFVECAWRLQTQDSVLCTWLSSNRNGESRHNELTQLIGRRVMDLKVCMPAGDLEIAFEDGKVLVIFADQANEVDQSDNYTFYSSVYAITNGHKSSISVRPIGGAD
jgi:hypothetical protein